MDFMEKHWLHGYALAHDRTFFDWQFVKNGKVDIWIGIDDEKRKLYAIQSAIFYRDVPNPDFSGSVWLAIKSPNPLLAFDVQNVMWSEMKPRDTFSPGLRPDAVKIKRLMGETVVAMDHYYRLNDIERYDIAVIKDKRIPVASDTGFTLVPISQIKDFECVITEKELINSAPSKDYAYINWRYFNHPIFKYNFWKVLNPETKPCAILITREEYANNSKCCKIIDFYGLSETLGYLASSFDRLMQENDYEYIDVYSYGVPSEIYENGGLTRCDEKSANIIPNYFQPYTPTNSDIFLVPPSTPGTRLFRGDSDQDKPRLLR